MATAVPKTSRRSRGFYLHLVTGCYISAAYHRDENADGWHVTDGNTGELLEWFPTKTAAVTWLDRS